MKNSLLPGCTSTAQSQQYPPTCPLFSQEPCQKDWQTCSPRPQPDSYYSERLCDNVSNPSSFSLPNKTLTSRIYRANSHIPPGELTRQQRHQMIRRSLTRRITRQIHIRAIMHTRTTTRHNHNSTSYISAFHPVPEIQIPSCLQQMQQRYRQEIVRCGVDLEGADPVFFVRGPEGFLEGGQGCCEYIHGFGGVAPDAGVGD